jgi:hypothetical protein
MDFCIDGDVWGSSMGMDVMEVLLAVVLVILEYISIKCIFLIRIFQDIIEAFNNGIEG